MVINQQEKISDRGSLIVTVHSKPMISGRFGLTHPNFRDAFLLPLFSRSDAMKKTAIVIGATGLVGRELTSQLLQHDSIGKVKVFTRRPTGIRHALLDEHVINFETPDEWQDKVTGDVLYSTLGTTLKQAGSKSAQYKVDYTYQHSFADIASKNKVPAYVLVSSMGANPNSALFYPRIKGELDLAVQVLPFKSCVIIRPSILVGEREKKRIAETIAHQIMKVVTRYALRKYRPIAGTEVARAMIAVSLDNPVPGTSIHEADAIFQLI